MLTLFLHMIETAFSVKGVFDFLWNDVIGPILMVVFAIIVGGIIGLFLTGNLF